LRDKLILQQNLLKNWIHSTSEHGKEFEANKFLSLERRMKVIKEGIDLTNIIIPCRNLYKVVQI
jgi:hypothetical protein